MSELGHLLILGDKEARGRVGRPCRGCGRVYRRQLEQHRGRCTRRRTALRLAAAGGQLYRRSNRGLALPGAARGGSWSLAWLVSTPTAAAAACCTALPHVAQGRCHHACPETLMGRTLASLTQLASQPHQLFSGIFSTSRGLTLNLNSSD